MASNREWPRRAERKLSRPVAYATLAALMRELQEGGGALLDSNQATRAPMGGHGLLRRCASRNDGIMRIALFQPDQAGNVGTILRLAACLGTAVDIIEPCGFPWSDRALKRAGMDYAEIANVTRHADWAAFEAALEGRLALFTTAGAMPLPAARFEANDTLLFGSESHGVPEEVHERANLRVRIPQVEGTRSLNIAVAAGIGVAEALRQTGLWAE